MPRKWTVRYEAQSDGKIFTLKKVACNTKAEAERLLQELPDGSDVDKDLWNQVYTVTLPDRATMFGPSELQPAWMVWDECQRLKGNR